MFFRNKAGQKLIAFAFDSATGLPKTGDAANITCYVSKDYGTVTVLGDTSATEMDATNAKGYYLFDLTQGETDAEVLLFSGKSTTSGIVITCCPATVFTVPATGILAPVTAGRTLVVDAAGLADANMVKMGPTGAGTAQTALDLGIAVGSGSLYVASGSIFMKTFASGVVGGGSGNLPSSWGASGAVTDGQNLDKVGYSILSGVINSGQNVVVPIASISGVVANSGLNVTADVARWLTVAPNALTSSGRLDAAFNIRTGVARSGTASTIQLDAGVPTGISGSYDNQIITLVGGTGAGRSRTIVNMGSSGIAFVSPSWDASGVPDTTSIFTITPGSQTFSGLIQIASGPSVISIPYSGMLSGQPVTSLSVSDKAGYSILSGVINSGQNVVSVPLSGLTFPASGSIFLASGSVTSGLVASGIVFIASGPSVNAVASVSSGSLYLASGSIFMNTFASGVVGGGSGNLPSSWGASGAVTLGQNLDKAGYSTLSGVINSGQNTVSVPLSGLTFPASGSIFLASGSITSGLVASGIVYLASGAQVVSQVVADKSGYTVGTNLDKTSYTTSGWSGTLFPAPASLFAGTYASGVLTAEIPSRILKFDYSGTTGEAQRSLLNATRKLINKFDAGSDNSGFLTVYKEDDSTQAYKQAITATSGAYPITSLDTA